jgi:hypothetical protein
MPSFNKRVLVAFVDVDLAESTKDCVKCLYPRLASGGHFLSHDGHLPLVVKVFEDAQFWASDVGAQKPPIPNLGAKKLVHFIKP